MVTTAVPTVARGRLVEWSTVPTAKNLRETRPFNKTTTTHLCVHGRAVLSVLKKHRTGLRNIKVITLNTTSSTTATSIVPLKARWVVLQLRRFNCMETTAEVFMFITVLKVVDRPTKGKARVSLETVNGFILRLTKTSLITPQRDEVATVMTVGKVHRWSNSSTGKAFKLKGDVGPVTLRRTT